MSRELQITQRQWLWRLGPLGLSLLTALGCSEQPEAVTPADVHDEEPIQEEVAGFSSGAEIGGMNASKVDEVFTDSFSQLESCLRNGSHRIEFLGGSVEFYIKINSAGRLDAAYLESSSLGDRNTEVCMLEALRSKIWPSPVGGRSGFARKSLGFEAPSDVRPPTLWHGHQITNELADIHDDISSCRGSVSGSFTATMYVNTDGSVLSAGIAPPNAQGEAAADCLVEKLLEAKFPLPGSWPAKVQFTL